ncbi:MAG TPA: threonine--tRNA ligase [Candidatus Saccharimonadales bacterium]|nr:threonine--tRNA ligase [Candidatus Saccharimonadales bacterium]
MESKNLQNIRHSTAHLLAAAVKQLWPDAKNAIGPAIENGYYQDFDMGNIKLSDEDFPKIEAKMREILKEWKPFVVKEVSVEQAKKDFSDNPYKLELIEEFGKEGKTITENNPGNFLDLCKGGHSKDPQKDMKHFKLLSIAGAYWRGDENNKMLTRIYGTAFESKKELDEYLEMLEESKKRDHKKLGKEMELFFFDETAPGMTYWLPKGLIVYNTLYDFTRKMYKKYGYQEVMTPQINKKELFETSGHWFHYREDMFVSPMSYLRGESKEVLEGTEVFGMKPMNCPNAMTIFRLKTRSYNDLPMRLAETSMLHRFELSGTLNGLFRTRQFRQDDAHVFITLDQIKEEFASILDMIEDMYRPFNLQYQLRFGTRGEEFMGDPKEWDIAENALKDALDNSGKKYFTAAGEAAFYGPKIDILMKDSLGREWQTGTIQLDFQQPKNFELKYIDSAGKEVQPISFHRAIYGSLERFLGVLIEHYAGKFPLWLAPTQVSLLAIADRHNEFVEKAAQQLREAGIRVEADTRSERLQAKIREATLQKVPFMGIIGDKEVATSAISVRKRNGEDLGQIKIASFLEQLIKDIDKKS